jgi:8-oxo-dGTP pyrophosphatase MutT (NUDIX family)
MKEAAVLLLILEREGAPCILFTKRTQTVAHHKGEISFPGGVRDKRDKNLLETALRETKEEIGIPAGKIEILGELDDNVTKVTNFHLTSYVGMLLPPVAYKASDIEIEG